MISHILAGVVIGYSLLYVLVAVVVALGALRFRKPGRLPERLPRVSVVLCARNEEHNIPRCLGSLIAVDYPPEKIEIILVDDESADRTLELFGRYARGDARIKVLSTAGEPRTLIGKQRPLNLGIRESTGEIVLGVDADVAVRPGWVKAHVAAQRGRVAIAGGTTRIDPFSRGLFARMQACDLATKFSIAMGCAGLGFPLTIMGNNISFRRDVYESIGGFGKMKPRIVEDTALMNAVTRDAGYRLGWAAGPDGVADSAPEELFYTFIEQRRRWLNAMNDLSLIPKLLFGIELVMTLMFAVSLLLALHSPAPLLAIIVAWLLGYVVLLAVNSGSTGKDYLFIPVMILFQMYYGMVIGFRNTFGSRTVMWKGREYS